MLLKTNEGLLFKSALFLVLSKLDHVKRHNQNENANVTYGRCRGRCVLLCSNTLYGVPG